MAAPNRPAPRILALLARRQVTPNMLRLTLGGPELADFPEGQDGGYVKLMLPVEGSEKPVVRTYTIRHQRTGELDVDFVLHAMESGNLGPATAWAVAAEIGQTIAVGGPGPAKPLPEGVDHYLIAGDMTALPAISVNLEALPQDATGRAVIEIAHEDDRQDIAAPAGVEVIWLINPYPGQQSEMLVDGLRSAPWPQGRVYGWAAAEFSAMRALRRYLFEEQGLTRENLYISSYWKHGSVEDEHKQAKREDAESAGL